MKATPLVSHQLYVPRGTVKPTSMGPLHQKFTSSIGSATRSANLMGDLILGIPHLLPFLPVGGVAMQLQPDHHGFGRGCLDRAAAVAYTICFAINRNARRDEKSAARGEGRCRNVRISRMCAHATRSTDSARE
jgi:hypothetical protein